MFDIRKLQAKGFTVRLAPDAVCCTEVVHNEIFYYYNPRFATTPEDVYAALKTADSLPDGGYRIVLAGDVSLREGQLPISIVPLADVANVSLMRSEIQVLRQDLSAKESSFNEAMKAIMYA